MCGRFALGLIRRNVRDMVAQAYPDQNVAEWIDEEEFVPRYNIAPRTQSPVIRRRRAGAEEISDTQDISPELIMHTMKWGLVPHWSKREDKTLSTINARAENLIEGGHMWDSIKGRKRCIIICQGYYEWLRKEKEKQPHFTRYKDGKLMLLAGLYDRVVLEGETKPLWTFTIVTTDANKDFQWLHDRQPVILTNLTDMSTWLDTSSQKWTKDLAKLLLPYHDENSPLECYAVPQEVGKVGNESPAFIEPISQRKDGIEAMFAKQTRKKAASPMKSSQSSAHKFSPAGKRKRRLSPALQKDSSVVDLVSDDEEPPKKRDKDYHETMQNDTPRQEEKVTDDSNAPQTGNLPELKYRKSAKSNLKNKKEEEEDKAGAEPKITQFFGKP